MNEDAQATAGLASLRADLTEAAGELLVPIPKPGTQAAKLLSANVLLKRENASLRARLETAEAALRAILDVQLFVPGISAQEKMQEIARAALEPPSLVVAKVLKSDPMGQQADNSDPA